MNKRYFFWGLGLALSVVFLSLLGVQYFYFSRLDKLHKSQTKQLAHLALQRVVQEIEVRELVRYLNGELNANTHQNSKLLQALKETRRASMRDARITIQNPSHVRDASPMVMGVMIDSMALSDKLLSTFLDNHEALDEHILRNLYRVYSYDSIPQLVNPRLLRERLRFQLNEVGVTEPFSVALCDADGVKLYEYTQPGMVHRRLINPDDELTQPLFVNRDAPNNHLPYLRLRLDFRQSQHYSMEVIIPGVIVTSLVLIIIIVMVTLIYRQLSFQAMKSSFINNMTHELKTPISSIQLAVEQMQRSPQILDDKAKRNHYITIMDAEVHRLKALIDKVLQLSLYGKGNDTNVSLSEMSIDEILLGAIKIFTMRINAEAPGGTLDLQHDAQNTWVMANETHMTNILYNLLENAIKYRNPERNLELILRTYNAEDGNLIIEVEDNGLGIPESDTKLIFERFYRVSDGLKHNIKGHGLGLAYVHSIVKQFKGTIIAKNKPEGGLLMRITLPTIQY